MSRWGTSLLVVATAATLVACGPTAPEKGQRAHANPRETLITPEAPAVQEPKQKRPNVLVIEADDMRWDDLRFMPNVQRLLQRRGLTFENSFAPYPLCCPSRASFLTGQYAHNHHVYSHEEPFGFKSFRDRRTIATVLQRAGYQTALIGKYLNGYGEQPVHGTSESSLHYVPPGWTQWMAGSDHQWQSGDPFHGGTYAYFNLTQNVNGEIKTFPGRYSTGVLGAQTRRVITDFGRGTKPWFVWWTPVAPHHGSPVEPDDPRGHPADRRRRHHLGHAGAPGLGQGPLRPPGHPRRRYAGRPGRPRRTPATSRATCAGCPSSRRRRRRRRPR